MKMTKSMILDFEDILVDSFSVLYRAYNHVLLSYGKKPMQNIDEFRKLYSSDRKKIALALGLQENILEEVQKRIDHYLNYNSQDAKVFEKIVKKVSSLTVPKAILTNGDKNYVTRKLHKTQLSKDVKLVDAYDANTKEEQLRKGLELLNSKPEDAIYVCNNAESSAAAKIIGITTQTPEQLMENA